MASLGFGRNSPRASRVRIEGINTKSNNLVGLPGNRLLVQPYADWHAGLVEPRSSIPFPQRLHVDAGQWRLTGDVDLLLLSVSLGIR